MTRNWEVVHLIKGKVPMMKAGYQQGSARSSEEDSLRML